jgi:putative ABC transport system ATP-binding protein
VSAPLLEVRGLEKTYPAAEPVRALRGIDLAVARGEFVALMGPSGSGKSTLMNLLGCLDRPTAGHYLLEGEDVAGLGRDERALVRNRRIGFVFQGFNLLARTSAVENVELPLVYDATVHSRQARERAVEALRRVGLGDRLDHEPAELSGGQQQRVAIARALVAEPQLVLADEPTGNLDSHASDEIVALLRQVADEWGRAVVMVTHDPHIAAYADRILFLKDGAIVAETRPEARDAKAADLVADKIRQIA